MINKISFLLCLSALFFIASCADGKSGKADKLPPNPDIYAVIEYHGSDYTSSVTTYILNKNFSSAYNNQNPQLHSDHVTDLLTMNPLRIIYAI